MNVVAGSSPARDGRLKWTVLFCSRALPEACRNRVRRGGSELDEAIRSGALRAVETWTGARRYLTKNLRRWAETPRRSLRSLASNPNHAEKVNDPTNHQRSIIQTKHGTTGCISGGIRWLSFKTWASKSMRIPPKQHSAKRRPNKTASGPGSCWSKQRKPVTTAASANFCELFCP